MTKSEIISQIAQKAGVTNKVVGGVLNAFIGLVKQTLKEDGEIRIDKLGTFRVVQKIARRGVHPRTREKINIPATRAPSFRASKVIKEAVK